MTDTEEAPSTPMGLLRFRCRRFRVEFLQSATASFTAPSLLILQPCKYNFVSVLFSTNILATAVAPSTCSPMELSLKFRSSSVVFFQSAAASSTAASLLMWQSCKYNTVSAHLELSLSTDAKLSTFAILK